MKDSSGRTMVDLEFDFSWRPDIMVVSAFYEDDGSPVPEEELMDLDNDMLALYIAGVS